MKDKIRVALVGCGTVANYGHLPAITRNPDFKLVGVCDVHAIRRGQTAARYRTVAYESLARLCREQSPELMVVATNVQYHAECIRTALKAGCHVFAEKPLTLDVESAERCVRLAKAQDRILAVNFEFRFADHVRRMVQIMERGVIGTPQVLRFVYNWAAHGIHDELGRRRAAFLAKGGGAFDCAIHFIDLTRYLANSEFGWLQVMGHWVEKEYLYPGHIFIQARMRNGVTAHIESSFTYGHTTAAQPYAMQAEIEGDRGLLSYQMAGVSGQHSTARTAAAPAATLTLHTARKSTRWRIRGAKPWDWAYRVLLRALQAGSLRGSNLATGEDGLAATLVMEHCLHVLGQTSRRCVTTVPSTRPCSLDRAPPRNRFRWTPAGPGTYPTRTIKPSH